MEYYFIVALFAAFSLFWAWLWVKTYKRLTAKRFLLHTLLFVALSLLASWVAARIVFLPVDSTYSASNIGALGLLFIMFLVCFASGCIAAFGITLGKLLGKDKAGDG